MTHPLTVCAILYAALACLQAATAAESAAEVVEKCAQSADEDVLGLVELDEECPGLESALVDAGFAPFLSELQSVRLTGAALDDLAQLHEYYEHAAEADAQALQIGEIANIVRGLERVASERPLSLKERFTRWLREMFERRQGSADSWLARWLREISLPQSVSDLLVYGLITLVIVLATVVLVNELRAASVLKRSRYRLQLLETRVGEARLATLTFADLDAAALHDKPSLLLQLMLAALVASGRLQSERSLTPRELTARASFDAQAQREQFHHIAVAAERARYGREPLAGAQIETMVAEGRALLAEIKPVSAR